MKQPHSCNSFLSELVENALWKRDNDRIEKLAPRAAPVLVTLAKFARDSCVIVQLPKLFRFRMISIYFHWTCVKIVHCKEFFWAFLTKFSKYNSSFKFSKSFKMQLKSFDMYQTSFLNYRNFHLSSPGWVDINWNLMYYSIKKKLNEKFPGFC